MGFNILEVNILKGSKAIKTGNISLLIFQRVPQDIWHSLPSRTGPYSCLQLPAEGQQE